MKGVALVVTALLARAQGPGMTPGDRLLNRLAIESAADAAAPPIEIKIEGGRQFAIYDRFRLVALAARDALRAGHPLDPESLPESLRGPRVVVLALARSPMSGDSVQPQFVQINGRSGKRLKADDVLALLPGVTVPRDAVVFSFDLSLKPADRISIVFNERTGMMPEARGGGVPGAMTPGTLTAPVDIMAPEAIDSPVPLAPPGLVLSSPRVEVHVEGVLDLTGRVRFAKALDGPPELQAIAAEAVGRWRYKPAMMFHVPIPLVMRATVTFTQ